MKNLRNRIEAWFETYAHVIYRNRIKTIVIMLVLTAAMISQIPKITIDTSTEGFLHTDDPELVAYNNFRDQFGRDEVIIIAIQSADIFSQKFLETNQKLHEDLEENVPFYVKNRLYYISERKEKKIKKNIYLKWIAAVIGTIVLFLNLFYFTNIFPAANRTLHLVVSEIENFAVNTEAFFEKMKESGDNFLFGFFTENGDLENSDKSQGSDDKGGKNG